MTRRRDDKTPEPEGGRAAARLRDFLRRRSIEGEPAPAPPDQEPDAEEETIAEEDDGR
jgi:hypothetical protein